MNVKNHILFNTFFIFLLKNSNVFKFSYVEWYIIFFISLISCILPDIDHPNSIVGRKIKFISIFIIKKIGHRELTHSLIFLIFIHYIFKFFLEKNLIMFSKSIYYGITIGYFTHILADMMTNNGVSLLWPIKKKIKIKLYNFILILIIYIYYIIFIKRNFF